MRDIAATATTPGFRQGGAGGSERGKRTPLYPCFLTCFLPSQSGNICVEGTRKEGRPQLISNIGASTGNWRQLDVDILHLRSPLNERERGWNVEDQYRATGKSFVAEREMRSRSTSFCGI